MGRLAARDNMAGKTYENPRHNYPRKRPALQLNLLVALAGFTRSANRSRTPASLIFLGN